MNIFAALFGSSKNTETIVDGAVKGIDKLFFTAEEKAEMGEKTREWFLRYLEATQPMNLARRFIALILVGLWAGLVVAGVAAWSFSQDFSAFVFKVLVDVVTTPFSLVVTFYFAAHIVRQYKQS